MNLEKCHIQTTIKNRIYNHEEIKNKILNMRAEQFVLKCA